MPEHYRKIRTRPIAPSYLNPRCLLFETAKKGQQSSKGETVDEKERKEEETLFSDEESY